MGFRRFIGFAWTPGPGEPIDPGFGGGIGAPVDPDWGMGGGFRPDNSLPGGGHISSGPIYGGGYPSHGLPGGGHISNKPPGAPIIPIHPGNRPPNSGLPPHAGWPGHWEPIDPGWGKPPLWGFFPVDPGWGVDVPVGPDQGLPGVPPGHVSGQPVLPGNWVPTDPDYGLPVCPGGRPKPPRWAWIPAPPDLSKPVPPTDVPPPTAGTPLPPAPAPK